MNQASRTRLLSIFFLIIGAVFIGRLFHLQVLQHDKYQALAASVQQGKFELPATRGEIYAKSHDQVVPLVLNEPVYTVFADPKVIEDEEKTVEVMRRVAGGDVVDNFEALINDNSKRYVVLARQVNRQQAELIEEAKLFGVGLKPGQKRVYPEGNLLARTLGYVNAAGLGQYGVEGALNDRLSGEPGVLKATTDAAGVPLSGPSSENTLVEPRNGDDIVLSIDRNIQAYVEEALKKGLENAEATRGNALVMDPQTGKVLAMASLPTYNPGKYYEVNPDNYEVFQNPVVSDPYEAGSGIKTLTMAAGINEGVITPETTFTNYGFETVDGVKIKNAVPGRNLGERTMTEVLEYSLNSGAMFVLQQLGGGQINGQAREILHSYFANRYHFGTKTGIAQTNEQTGLMMGPNEGYGRDVRYATMAFGQGFSVTMLRAAAAFSAIINGGTLYQPALIAGELKDDGSVAGKAPVVERQDVISKESSDTMREMIYQARHRTFGSYDTPGYLVGGKTGTSQTIDPETGEYREDHTIATYTGFGGNESPDYVVMIRIVDSRLPGFGGTVAAQPIFAEISNWLLEYMRVPKVK